MFCEEVRRRQGVEAETWDLPRGRVGPCLETKWDVVCCACRTTEGGLAVLNPTFLGVENLPGLFLLLMRLFSVAGRAGSPALLFRVCH